ncbi:ABC transporter ATP-binding protein [Caulobacter segnis]|uniref:ABC transporter ATP-binding protein n=1 Tax=Caulobacter segnis TaxID=88688 RepID=UPI00240F4CF5|nr:ABC transporter ATP-binding protein [Caulobacter segnis]MDG2521846.1 ABC transporter ATP-binding protein [Caulobacter segnis]
MTPELGFSDIHVRLGDKPVLEGVSADLHPGQVTAIVGPNGAGKSTLLACLAGLRRPDMGLARLNGVGVLELAARERGRRIGFLPQSHEIAWSVEARTLVGLGRIPFAGSWGLSVEDEAAVERAMTKADVTQFATRTVTTLSGGELARVLIARALAGDPQWLLADEPLAGLDPGHQLDAAALFRALADEGKGVVVTLHDLPMAMKLADRVIVLADGKILADGPPVEALAPPILSAAYGVEARFAEGGHGPLIEIVGRHG